MQRSLAFILFVLLIPITLIASLLIIITSGFPVIFTQERVGFQKQAFTIFKFRTMHNGKITLIGKVLRKTGVDEIPQLINIFKGEMAFVGPRPLTQADITRLNWDTNEYKLRWSVKPGITGPAQLVNVCDKNVSWQNDLYYIEHKSNSLDRKIIWQSILIPFIGKQKVKSIIHNIKT